VTEPPLVTISIPAYRARYLRPALDSAVGQTWPRCEIFVSQDGTDPDIPPLCAEFPGVTLVRGPSTVMRDNFDRCMALGTGPYVKLLLDDDVLAPDCVARMVGAFEGPHGAGITLVTSRRWEIDAEGRRLRLLGGLPGVTNDGIVPRNSLWRLVIERLHNFVGEMSTVMMRRASIEQLGPRPSARLGVTATGQFDLRVFLALNRLGAAYVFAEPLSAFRRHPDQNSAVPDDMPAFLRRQQSWLDLVDVAAAEGLIDAACQRRGMDRVERLVLSMLDEHPTLSFLLQRVRRRQDALALWAGAGGSHEIAMVKPPPLD